MRINCRVALLLILGLIHLGLSCKGKPNPYPTIDATFSKVASH